MIYAAPFKMNKENSAISTVFGKAKYFGIYDDATNTLEVIVNENPGGPAIFKQLHQKNVQTILTPHAGPGAVRNAPSFGMKIFYCGDERIEMLDAVAAFGRGEYVEITEANFEQFHHHH